MKTHRVDNGWGVAFKIRRLGQSTFYAVWKDTGIPASPDFRERHLCAAYMRKNWQEIMVEGILLENK